MSESKRGAVLLIRAGDPEISGAIADGIMTARGAGAGDLIRPAARATFPIGGRLSEEQRGAGAGDLIRPAARATFPNGGRLSEEQRRAGDGDLIRPAARATFPIGGRLIDDERRGSCGGGRLSEEQRRAVEAEIDRQAIAEGMNRRSVNKALLRVAVGNHKTAEDYQQMLFDAEVAYGESVYEPTPMQQLKEKALIVDAMFVEAVATAYRAQDRVLEKRI